MTARSAWKSFSEKSSAANCFRSQSASGLHAIVEPGDLNPAVGRLQAGEDRRQGVQGVGDGPAVGSGVQVAVGALHQDLEVGQPFQPVSDRGRSRGKLAAIGNDGVVAGEPLGLLGHIGFQVCPANLFLALDDELDVHRQLARGLEPRLGGFQMREHLAFVVGGAAGVEIAVALGGLERGREPRLERFGGLDVVMSVDSSVGLPGRTQPLGIDDRVALGLDQLGLEPRSWPDRRAPRRRPARVGVVIGLGADAGNADQGLELLLEIAPMGLQIGLHASHIHHRLPPDTWAFGNSRSAQHRRGAGEGTGQYNIAGAGGRWSGSRARATAAASDRRPLHQPPMMAATQRGWIGEFPNQHESFFRSKGLCCVGANAYKMLARRLYG